MSKIEFCGISGKANKLFQSYLNNRYQRVVLNNNSVKYSSKLEPVKHGVPQGSILGLLFFLLYIIDLPTFIYDISKPVLFADKSSIITTNSNPSEFKKNINNVFIRENNWFQSNLLSPYFDKTHFLQSRTKNNQENDMQIFNENKRIINSYNTKLLRLIIDGSLYWKVHIDELIAKLNKACYAIRSVKLFMFLEVLRMIYFSYVHSIIQGYA